MKVVSNAPVTPRTSAEEPSTDPLAGETSDLFAMLLAALAPQAPMVVVDTSATSSADAGTGEEAEPPLAVAHPVGPDAAPVPDLLLDTAPLADALASRAVVPASVDARVDADTDSPIVDADEAAESTSLTPLMSDLHAARPPSFETSTPQAEVSEAVGLDAITERPARSTVATETAIARDDDRTSDPTSDPMAGIDLVQASDPTTSTEPSETTTEVATAAPTEQIARVIRATKPIEGVQRVEIELTPEDLGSVTVELTLEHGTLHVTMVAETAEASDALRQGLDQLRQEFGAVDVRTLDVRDQSRGFDPRSEHDATRHPLSSSARLDTGNDLPAATDAASAPSMDADQQLDVRI